MKNSMLLLGIVFSLNCFGQNAIKESELVGCWTESREENVEHSKVSIYRPCDFKTFPPSRFRFEMKLNKDHSCSWLQASPRDAHKMVDGRWSFDEKSCILKITNGEGDTVQQFKVAELEKDVMKISIK